MSEGVSLDSDFFKIFFRLGITVSVPFSVSNFLSLGMFRNSWSNPYTEFTIFGIKFRFAYGEVNFHGNTLNCKDIMSVIVWKIQILEARLILPKHRKRYQEISHQLYLKLFKNFRSTKYQTQWVKYYE